MPTHAGRIAIALAVVLTLTVSCAGASNSPPAETGSPISSPDASPEASPLASPSPASPAPAPSTTVSQGPSADLAETLRGDPWRIVAATGIEDVDRLSPVEFREALVVGTGVCGYASDLAFPSPGEIDAVEVYWDSVICKDGDPADSRPALKAILEAANTGRVEGDGSVVLSGPAGEITLGR